MSCLTPLGFTPNWKAVRLSFMSRDMDPLGEGLLVARVSCPSILGSVSKARNAI